MTRKRPQAETQDEASTQDESPEATGPDESPSQVGQTVIVEHGGQRHEGVVIEAVSALKVRIKDANGTEVLVAEGDIEVVAEVEPEVEVEEEKEAEKEAD